MNDNEQLIAVAEVLGRKWHRFTSATQETWIDLLKPAEWIARHGGVECADPDISTWTNAGDLPWLTSLDACNTDIIPAMKKEGWLFDLENSPADPESWCCAFLKSRNGPIMATAPTAPRAIVKAFLMYNNRWVDQPENQRKGGNEL